jgi:hypothetical protein
MLINAENRDKIQDEYIQQMIDGMDIDTLASLAYDYLSKDKDEYTHKQLETEILEYYPEILGVEEDDE